MSWTKIIKEESDRPYFKLLQARILEDAKEHTVYPRLEDTYNAFKYSSFKKTKVVILGQDPYHGPNQAHGLSFSVQPNIAIPPSLRNIFKELKDDVGVSAPANGCLTGWARQGILLLNTTLTVRQGEPGSHADFGWQAFTDKIISSLNEKETPVVFILWGAHARKKMSLITSERHLIITAAHPSPFSAYNGFFGSKPFSTTNDFLIDVGLSPIEWNKIND